MELTLAEALTAADALLCAGNRSTAQIAKTLLAAGCRAATPPRSEGWAHDCPLVIWFTQMLRQYPGLLPEGGELAYDGSDILVYKDHDRANRREENLAARHGVSRRLQEFAFAYDEGKFPQLAP